LNFNNGENKYNLNVGNSGWGFGVKKPFGMVWGNKIFGEF
jgi:hypothetical protein